MACSDCVSEGSHHYGDWVTRWDPGRPARRSWLVMKSSAGGMERVWTQETLITGNSSLGPLIEHSSFRSAESPPLGDSLLSLSCFMLSPSTRHYLTSCYLNHFISLTLYFLQHWFTQLHTVAGLKLGKGFILSSWPPDTSLFHPHHSLASHIL